MLLFWSPNTNKPSFLNAKLPELEELPRGLSQMNSWLETARNINENRRNASEMPRKVSKSPVHSPSSDRISPIESIRKLMKISHNNWCTSKIPDDYPASKSIFSYLLLPFGEIKYVSQIPFSENIISQTNTRKKLLNYITTKFSTGCRVK